jgi:chromate transporter
VPGPLFTFAAYLGAVMPLPPNGLLGGIICLTAIYLPSFLLLIGILPFWEALRRQPAVRSALDGANAVVVGLLSPRFIPRFGRARFSARAISQSRFWPLSCSCFGKRRPGLS